MCQTGAGLHGANQFPVDPYIPNSNKPTVHRLLPIYPVTRRGLKIPDFGCSGAHIGSIFR
jgi:hypothetical protein